MAVDDILKQADSILSNSDEVPNYQELEQTLLINFLRRYSAISKQLVPDGFRKFVSLETKNASVQFSNITSQKANVAPFIEYGGHPLLASARTPNIRLYKIFKNENNDPVDEVEIPLFLYGTQNVLNVQDRSTEAFFKGLSFDFNDQTAYGASRMVKAQLSLGFNSFSAINKEYIAISKSQGKEVPFSYVDLIRRVKHRNVGQEDPTGPVLDPTEYYSYSLRMEISWNNPSSELIKDGNLQAAGAAGAEVNHIVLLLELEDYEIDVQQNGLINLSLNYYSYMEREMERKIDYDVFGTAGVDNFAKSLVDEQERAEDRRKNAAISAATESPYGAAYDINQGRTAEEDAAARLVIAKNKVQKIEEQIRELKSELELSKNSTSPTPEAASAASERRNEILEELKDKAEQLERSGGVVATYAERLKKSDQFNSSLNKVSLFSSFMTRILNSGHVWYVQVPQEDLLMFSPKYKAALKEASAGQEINEADILAGVKKRKQELAQFIAKTEGANLSYQQESAQNYIAETVNYYIEQQEGDREDADIEKALSMGLNSVLTEIFGKQDLGLYQTVYFMYFGDLVKELIADDLFEQLNRNKIGIILGNVNHTREIDFYDNLEQVSTKTSSINIADVPISIQYFSQFFANEIINKNFEKMSIFDFIRGVINQCLIPAMNTPVGGIPVTHPVSMRSKHMQMTNKFPNMYKTLANYEYGRYDIDNDSIKALDKIRKLTNHQTLKLAKAEQIWNYLYVYGTETKNITGLSDNYDIDMERGVYHFTFGDATNLTNSGNRTDLIKDIKFTKVKKSGQREMMVERQMMGGNIDRNIELWNIFDVEMTMIGNNLLAPGKHFYVNPLIKGFDRSKNGNTILSELGMGGYYMATDVSNEIGDNGEWVTRVKGAWQSNGIVNRAAAEGKAITVAEKEAIESGGSAPDAVIELGAAPSGDQGGSDPDTVVDLGVLDLSGD